MSVAEVVSMAMAELLVVMFEDIKATWQDVSKEDFFEKKNLYRDWESSCW